MMVKLLRQCIIFVVIAIIGISVVTNIFPILLILRYSKDFKVDGCQMNLSVMLKQLLFFISFRTPFVGDILWWTDRVIIFFFQIMQYVNFRNLNRVTFARRKHLESLINPFWCCFQVIKQYSLSLFNEIGSHFRESELR